MSRLHARLAELNVEADKGRQALAETDAEIAALQAERIRLHEQLLRISGAVRALEELIAESEDDSDA